ncbi:MAG: alcohol dehydrogenase family protein [Candidatus Sedimenticola sp. 1PA]
MTNIPNTMRGIWLLGHGDFDKLEIKTDIPVPAAGDNDVLIRVSAAGINNTDINTRIGWYSKNNGDSDDASWAGEPIRFPRIQGIDVCGTIVDVGVNVPESRIGERVLVEPCLREASGQLLESPWFLGSECDGGFAEYVRVASRHAYRITSPLSATELATFPCSYSTAENMLTRSDVKTGEVVLVTGASGGVGSAALQLVQARGAKAIAVTSPEKTDRLIELGAYQAISRNENIVSSLGENSVDVVIDLVGGDSWPELLQVLKPCGRYAVSGAIGGPIVSLDLRTLYLKDLAFFGCTVLEDGVFRNLVDHIENDRIKPLVSKVFQLEDIVEAQQKFLQKKHIGKIVLEVNTEG